MMPTAGSLSYRGVDSACGFCELRARKREQLPQPAWAGPALQVMPPAPPLRAERLSIDTHGRTICLLSPGTPHATVIVVEPPPSHALTVAEGLLPPRRYCRHLPSRLRAPAAATIALRTQALQLLLELCGAQGGGGAEGGGDASTATPPPPPAARAPWAARLAEALLAEPRSKGEGGGGGMSWSEDSVELAACWARNWACGADPCVAGAQLQGRDWAFAAAAAAAVKVASTVAMNGVAAPPAAALAAHLLSSPPPGDSCAPPIRGALLPPPLPPPQAPPASAASVMRWPFPALLCWAPSWVAVRALEGEAWVYATRLLPLGGALELQVAAAVVAGRGAGGEGCTPMDAHVRWVQLPPCTGGGRCKCGGGGAGCDERAQRLRGLLQTSGWLAPHSGTDLAPPPPFPPPPPLWHHPRPPRCPVRAPRRRCSACKPSWGICSCSKRWD